MPSVAFSSIKVPQKCVGGLNRARIQLGKLKRFPCPQAEFWGKGREKIGREGIKRRDGKGKGRKRRLKGAEMEWKGKGTGDGKGRGDGRKGKGREKGRGGVSSPP